MNGFSFFRKAASSLAFVLCVFAISSCFSLADYLTNRYLSSHDVSGYDLSGADKDLESDSRPDLDACFNFDFDSDSDSGEIADLRKKAWIDYVSAGRKDKTRRDEFANKSISANGYVMNYGLRVKGDIKGKKVPVYIALHGGGATSFNSFQWQDMAGYYYDSIGDGIYVYPRAIEDTYDCHWRPASFPMYDELISNLKLFENRFDASIDLNRVYLLGFSAGGDGVYRISPVMADRFAAVNMSAGHPNGVDFSNMRNLPILLQVGQNDSAYNRNKVVAQYDLKLRELAQKYGGGYVHEAYIHKGMPHNFNDSSAGGDAVETVIADPVAWLESDYARCEYKKVDSSAGAWVAKYERNPLPEKIVWNLKKNDSRFTSRSVQSFYWLCADNSVVGGTIVASYSKASNAVVVESNTVQGDVSILLNDRMMDFSKPITIMTEKGTFEVEPDIDLEVLAETTAERGDPDYQFLMRVSLAELEAGAASGA